MTKNNIYFYFNEKEEQVMKVLWEKNKPLSASEIGGYINSEWAKKSIQNVIRKLEAKGAIEIAEITKICKTYGRLFRPTISSEEYALMQFDKFYSKDTYIPFILSALVNETDESSEFINDLKELIRKYKGE